MPASISSPMVDLLVLVILGLVIVLLLALIRCVNELAKLVRFILYGSEDRYGR